MTTRVQKWGNSLAVRLPLPVVKRAGIRPDDPFEIQATKGRILLIPAAKAEYRLSDLLRKVTRKNLHRATDWGKPVGNEVW